MSSLATTGPHPRPGNTTEAPVRDLIITENITLDGVIDASEGWFAPPATRTSTSPTSIAALNEQSEAADALPRRPQRRSRRCAATGRSRPTTRPVSPTTSTGSQKYVVSSTLEDPGWERTTVLRGPLEDESGRSSRARRRHRGHRQHDPRARAHRRRPGRRVPPVRLSGRARPRSAAVRRRHRRPRLRLVEARPFRSGIVLLRYRPA